MPPALESFVRESPLVAGAVALVAIVFLVALFAAIVSGLRGRRRRAAIRREPRLYGVVDDRDDDLPAYSDAPTADPPSAPPPVRARAPRRGFGFAALTLAFSLGLLAGMGAMLTSRQDIAAALSRLAALVAAEGVGTAPAATPTAPVAPLGDAAPAVASPPDRSSAPAADVGERLANFATSLEASLPRQAGPDLSLESVSLDGTTLNLAYKLGRALPQEDVAPFQAYIDRTVRSLFCAEEAREIRYLSQNGVIFHMTYTDSSGANVSELTVTPGYCG